MGKLYMQLAVRKKGTLYLFRHQQQQAARWAELAAFFWRSRILLKYVALTELHISVSDLSFLTEVVISI
jgi:hypothetical protein